MKRLWLAWARRWQPVAHLVRWARNYRGARAAGCRRLPAARGAWYVARAFYGTRFHG